MPHSPTTLPRFALGAIKMSAWLVKTARAPSRHGRDTGIYGHTTTAMHKLSTRPPRPAPICVTPGPTHLHDTGLIPGNILSGGGVINHPSLAVVRRRPSYPRPAPPQVSLTSEISFGENKLFHGPMLR